MKKQTYSPLLFIAFIIFSLSSCEKIIEFKGEVTQPLIVLNSIVYPTDSIFYISVTKSQFFLESTEITYNNQILKDADVSLFVNGEFKEKVAYNSLLSLFSPIYQPAIGDKIRLEVSNNGFEKVWGETEVCKMPNVTKVDTTVTFFSENIITDYSWSGEPIQIGKVTTNDYKFKFYIKDDGREYNYYRLDIAKLKTYSDGTTDNKQNYSYYSDSQGNFYRDVVFDDIVFRDDEMELNLGDGTELQGYNWFNNSLFKGTEYGLSFSAKGEKYQYVDAPTATNKIVKSQIIITLSQINKDIYLYLKSMQKHKNSDNFFSEPVQIHSNVTNGIGIVGSQTSKITVIDLM